MFIKITSILFLLAILTVPTVSAQTATDEATQETDVVREKVREAVDKTLAKPRAYVGLVTDIVESTLQIENKYGEIEQAVILDEADIVSSGKTTKPIELADIAIGDFTITMGFVNGNRVLEAKRIVITDEVEETTRKAFKGTVSDKNKNSFTLQDGSDISVNVTKSTLTTSEDADDDDNLDFTDVVDEDVVIVVGEFDNGIVEARRVHIISKAPEPTEEEE